MMFYFFPTENCRFEDYSMQCKMNAMNKICTKSNT